MNERTIKNLCAYIEMMWHEEYNAGHYKLAADLRRLMLVLEDMKPTKK